ncbi:MAG: hypothetical protein K6C11_02880 [Bacilli bacterium]|nr:hypothetical protein [Bacilli bacterium]
MKNFKNKKKIFIPLVIITIGLLALILFLTSCNGTKSSEDVNYVHLDNKLMAVDPNVEYASEDIAGYKAGLHFIFTSNIDKKKAVEALKDYMVFYDGEPVHTDSEIVVNFNDKWVDVAATFPDKTTSHWTTGFRIVEPIDGVEFAAVTPSGFFRYACVIEKSTCPSNYDVNKIATYANTQYYHNIKDPVYDLNYNDCLQEENEIWSSCTMMTGNGKYHIAMANVRILNDLCVSGFKGTVNNTDSYDASKSSSTSTGTGTSTGTNNSSDSSSSSQSGNSSGSGSNGANTNTNDNNSNNDSSDSSDFFEQIKEKYNEFKDNNKEAADAATIVISSVLGIALLYIIFVIVRKIWRSLKK